MDIVIYGTSTCPYCVQAENLLKKTGHTTYRKIDVSSDREQFEVMMQRTGRRTVPQVFIDDRHVGGYSELRALLAGEGG